MHYLNLYHFPTLDISTHIEVEAKIAAKILTILTAKILATIVRLEEATSIFTIAVLVVVKLVAQVVITVANFTIIEKIDLLTD